MIKFITLCFILFVSLVIIEKVQGYYIDKESGTVTFESQRDFEKYYSDQVPDPSDAWVSMKLQYDLWHILKIVLIGGGIIFIIFWAFGKF